MLTIILFAIEVFIAKYAHDKIIRPYGGDYLVVILIYCFVRSFFNTSILHTATGVLLFSFLVEALQYFDIVDIIGAGHSKLAGIIIGTSFAWTDIVVYILGIFTVIVLEYVVGSKARV